MMLIADGVPVRVPVSYPDWTSQEKDAAKELARKLSRQHGGALAAVYITGASGPVARGGYSLHTHSAVIEEAERLSDDYDDELRRCAAPESGDDPALFYVEPPKRKRSLMQTLKTARQRSGKL